MQTFVGGDSRLEEQTGAETWPSQDRPVTYIVTTNRQTLPKSRL